MKCPNCSNDIYKGQKFCTNCGREIFNYLFIEYKDSNSKRANKQMLSLFIVLLASCALLLYLINYFIALIVSSAINSIGLFLGICNFKGFNGVITLVLSIINYFITALIFISLV